MFNVYTIFSNKNIQKYDKYYTIHQASYQTKYEIVITFPFQKVFNKVYRNMRYICSVSFHLCPQCVCNIKGSK